MCARIKHGGNVCKNQAWRECVQESSIEGVCVRIRHEKNLCSKYLLQSLQTFGSISFFSQIHRWICVKIELVLVWKVQKALPKIQLDRTFCQGATWVGSEGGCSGVNRMISMAKPLDFWFNQLFLTNPPLDLCQN